MKKGIWVIIGMIIVIGIIAQGVEPEKELIIEKRMKYPCENLSLDDTAYCLRDFVATFYNYTEREDTNKTAKDIIENGGDCHDYAILYNGMFKRLGFRTSIETILIREDENYIYGHQYLRVEDETGYCSVDQLNVHCFMYG